MNRRFTFHLAAVAILFVVVFGMAQRQKTRMAVGSQDIEELKKIKPEDLQKEIRAREIRSDVDFSDLALEQYTAQRILQPDFKEVDLNSALSKYRFS